MKTPLPSAGDVKDAGSIPGSWKIPWRREQLPTPVSLPGESHGQRSLAGCSPWGQKESDTTELLNNSKMSNLKNPQRMGTSCTAVSRGSQDGGCPASRGQVITRTRGWTRLWATVGGNGPGKKCNAASDH